jgi:hypothetical protein
VAGRFPLYTDADINGPVVQALLDHGWDVLRAIDVFPEGTDDEVHFAYAAQQSRVMVGNDIDVKLLAERWYLEQRPFRGLVWWPREHYRRLKPGDFVEAFEELACQDDPLAVYPLVHLRPRR